MIDLNDKTPRILKCDGTEVPITPRNGKDFKCEEIHEALRMERNPDPCFTLAGRHKGMLMVAEDNGFALGLPLNDNATYFYGVATRTFHNQIVGNCLLMPIGMMK